MSNENITKTALPIPLQRWWLRTRNCKLGIQMNPEDGMPACIEFYVPWWAWPLELIHRAIFGYPKLTVESYPTSTPEPPLS